MSDFLEQVFAAQALQTSPRRRRRKRDQGFSGRRYAVMLTLMASLTAVPSWVMLRAGAHGIDQTAAAGVQPLLVPQIDFLVPPKAPPEAQTPPLGAWREPQTPAQQPPQAAPPVLEGRSYVDTGPRPVQKRRPTKAETPSEPKAPAAAAPASAKPAAPTPPAKPVPQTVPAPPAPPAGLDDAMERLSTRIARMPDVQPVRPPQVQRPEPPHIPRRDVRFE